MVHDNLKAGQIKKIVDLQRVFLLPKAFYNTATSFETRDERSALNAKDFGTGSPGCPFHSVYIY